MKTIERDALMIGAGVLGLVWLAKYIKDNAGELGAGAVKAVADLGAGAVIGAGDLLGVPRTDESECDKALREGRTWDSSFSCPAGRFIRGVFD